MEETESIGRRIAKFRKLRGWTQLELANRTGYSLSAIEKIERGKRASERYSTLHSFAKVLGVDVSELTGQTNRTRRFKEHSSIPLIRRTLMSTAPSDEPYRDSRSLHDAVQTTISSRQRGKYAQFGADFPPLIEELRRAALADGSNFQVRADLAELLHAGSMLLRRLDYIDLTWIALHEARPLAQQSPDQLLLVANDWHFAELHMKTGNSSDAQLIAERNIRKLNNVASAPNDPKILSLLGTFHLIQSMISAQAQDLRAMRSSLAQADRAADNNGNAERNDYQTVFGPSNVSIFAVSASVESGANEAAIARSKTIHTDSIPTRERQARYLIDVARAYAQTEKPGPTLQLLIEAQKLAPEYVLNHVMARELVASLLDHEGRSTTPGLRTLARKMDITS